MHFSYPLELVLSYKVSCVFMQCCGLNPGHLLALGDKLRSSGGITPSIIPCDTSLMKYNFLDFLGACLHFKDHS